MDYSDEQLDQQLNELPREIQPARDLRSGIWHQIDAQARSTSRWRMAAVTAFLMVASSAITLVLVKRNETQTVVQVPAVSAGTHTLVRSTPAEIEHDFTDEARELQEILDQNRATLNPETVRIMEENLHIIDKAIAEAKAALAADPHSEMLIDLLRSAYDRKLEVLRQAAKSSVST